MEIFKALQNLEKYCFGLFFLEGFYLLHVIVEISFRTVFEAEYNIIFGFEGIIQINEIFVFNGKQYVLLILELFQLFGTGYRIFLDKLEGAVLRVELTLGEVDLGEAT